MRLGSWKGCALPGPFIWKDGPCKILGVWFGPDLQLEKNWSEVLEKVVAATEFWLQRRLSLEGRAEVCCSHIYSLAVYRLSVLPIPPTILFKLERILFQFLWAKRHPLVRREICYLHPSEAGLGVPNVEARRHTLRLTFLDRMCSRDTAAGSVWKEDAKQSFPSLEVCILLMGRPIGCPDVNAPSIASAGYLSLPPTRHDLTQGQKPEGQLKWG